MNVYGATFCVSTDVDHDVVLLGVDDETCYVLTPGEAELMANQLSVAARILRCREEDFDV